MTDRFPNLLSPIDIGPLTMRNRVLVTAHVPGLEQGGLVTESYIAYQRARAAGGAALQISGASAVHATGSVGAGRSLDNTQPEIEAGYARLAAAVHDEGGRFLIQLGHAAATVNDTDAGRPLLAPSGVISSLVRETPKEMTHDEIDEMIEAYATSAAKVVASGLDGVEILAAFGFLPVAFLSPLSNKRTDDYGGTLDNRLRFLLRVIEAVRGKVGDMGIVGVRMPGDERVKGGLSQEDLVEIAGRLAATGKVDYLNVIVGTNYDRLQRMEHWPPTPAPHGLFVPLAAWIKANVSVPVFTTGRIVDPAMAEAIVARGDADMVGMTRAHIADPRLVEKLLAGRVDDIRPCVGANLCIAQATEGKPIRCFHNPSAARELELGDGGRAGAVKRVVVVGGGPAGLEAARVAAERGHQVTLFEKETSLGGQLRRWAQAPLTREFSRTIDWYEGQLTRLQVQVRRGEAFDAGVAGSLAPDAIIVATGARPKRPETIEGEANSSIAICSTWSVMDDPPSGSHVVLIDEGGGRGGLGAVDMLLDDNRVTVIATDFAVGEMLNPNLRTPVYKRFLSSGAQFRPGEAIERLEGDTVVTRNIYSGAEHTIEDVDVLVAWRGNEVVATATDLIAAGNAQVVHVGDCVAPRQVHIAIAEGALAAGRL